MNAPPLDLIGVWTVILYSAVFLYVLLDGFDLGVGILYGLNRYSEEREIIMSSVAPVWDGNETWLILVSLTLLAVFPAAFSIIIPALYFPIVVMLLALIFRGVAFEFRFRDALHRGFWDNGFFWGSVVASFSQGIIIGAFIQGFELSGDRFAGGHFDWLRPFPLMTGVGVACGYTLLGAGWLVLKTEGRLQTWARAHGRRALVLVGLAIACVSVWTPAIHPTLAARWLHWPNVAYLAPIPIATAALGVAVWSGFASRHEVRAFFFSMALFAMCYLGLAVSVWPFVVPYHLSLSAAAASPSTQAFLLIGTLFLLPVILLYSGWSYWVFRGKARSVSGYH